MQEGTYRRNPYHNRDHGADVAQAAMWLLHAGEDTSDERASRNRMSLNLDVPALVQSESSGTTGGGARSQSLRALVEPLDVLSLLLAALGHDSDHTGQTNAFHVSTASEVRWPASGLGPLDPHGGALRAHLGRTQGALRAHSGRT